MFEDVYANPTALLFWPSIYAGRGTVVAVFNCKYVNVWISYRDDSKTVEESA